MMRHTDRPMGPDLVYTAAEQICSQCGNPVPVFQTIARPVQGLDGAFRLVRRDRQCRRCPGPPGDRPVFYAPRDLRVVLPKRIYGLDVTLCVGERHLREGVALRQVTRDLEARGVPVDQRHTGRILRDFLALASLARGDDAALRARLRAQGGIVLMVDGVQFDDRSPVLYMAWDSQSGTPLFGERKPFRGEEDLVPLLERVRNMDVPVIAVVTDKEKGLVPAVERVFPGVPYQFCHTHFLKNCAKPMQADLTALQASVRRRAEAVREIAKLVQPAAAGGPASDRGDLPAEPPQSVSPAGTTPPTTPASPHDGASTTPAVEEAGFVREICDLVRANSLVSGKAPLDPAELKRHDRLEAVRAVVHEAQKKPRRARRSPVAGA